MRWEEDTYDGTSAQRKVVLIVDKDKNGELSVGDYYYEFSIRSDQVSLDLGTLRMNHELKEVVAGNIP